MSRRLTRRLTRWMSSHQTLPWACQHLCSAAFPTISLFDRSHYVHTLYCRTGHMRSITAADLTYFWQCRVLSKQDTYRMTLHTAHRC